MINLFKIEIPSLIYPLMVFARNTGEAYEHFRFWSEHHLPRVILEDVVIAAIKPAELRQQPLLAAALQAQLIGVAWWIGHRSGWIIGLPDGEALGEIAPIEPHVQCFRGSGPDFPELLIFARSEEHAIQIFDQRSRDCYGWPADIDSVVAFSRWELTGSKVTLLEDMDRGFLGIGCECEDGFWRIFPADYEPPLL